MKKQFANYFTVAIGMLLLGLGLYLIKTNVQPQGVMKALPFISVGLGCGFFGHGMGEVISRNIFKNYPVMEKQINIEKLDERNIAIGNYAKAKAYDMMIFIFGALFLAFALMGIDMTIILLLVSAYLFVALYGVYYRCKFDKEM
ncbi:MAG: hypothetical protein ACM3X7_08410 [Solirubrobacterales bacterium]